MGLVVSQLQGLHSFPHSSMVQWKMAGYLKGNDPIGDTPILDRTMIMGGSVYRCVRGLFAYSLRSL